MVKNRSWIFHQLVFIRSVYLALVSVIQWKIFRRENIIRGADVFVRFENFGGQACTCGVITLRVEADKIVSFAIISAYFK